MRTRIKVFLVLLVLLAAGLAALLLTGVLDLRPEAAPFVVSGPVRAVRLPMKGADGSYLTVTPEMSAADAEAALQQAVDTAAADGANTIVFAVQSGDAAGVYFKDKGFAAVNDNLDTLAVLCAKAKAAGLQVFAEVAPFAALPDSAAAARGTLADKYYSETLRYNGARWFDPRDERAVQALAAAWARLARRYPVAGVVFDDLSFGADGGDLVTALTAVQKKMVKAAADKQVGLAFDGAAAPFSAAQFGQLAAAGMAPSFVAGADAGTLAAWQQAAGGAGVLPAAPAKTADDGDFLALLRSLALQKQLTGALLGDAGDLAADPAAAGRAVSYFDDLVTVDAPGVAAALTVSYPPDGASVWDDSIVLLGTSDPTKPLALSTGGTVTRAAGGSFEVAVPLAVGSNAFTLSQTGGASATVTVVRRQSTGAAAAVVRPDTTLKTELAGRYIRVTAQIASALSSADSDDAIAMTLRKGAVCPIAGTVETKRSGKIVTAYLLSSGDYLLADSAELLAADDAAARSAVLEAPQLQTAADGDLVLTLAGGTPVCYDDLRDGTLTLKFYDTTFSFDAAQLNNALVTDAKTEPLDPAADGGAGTRLTLTVAGGLWGYDVGYADGATVLTLCRAPVLSSETGRPLTGVTVLVDAGHGGDDTGARGAGAATGAAEKDVNLALALAIRDRLEQLGATVTMTRTDDSFPTLQDRLAQELAEKPDFFLAVHHNSTGLTKDTSSAKGLEAYYFDRLSAAFAKNLMSAVAGATGRAADDPRWNYFYVNRVTCSPSVLFEFGYLVNPDEFEDCAGEQGIRAAAYGVADAVVSTVAGSGAGGE